MSDFIKHMTGVLLVVIVFLTTVVTILKYAPLGNTPEPVIQPDPHRPLERHEFILLGTKCLDAGGVAIGEIDADAASTNRVRCRVPGGYDMHYYAGDL